jgi:hypothetical protein
MSPSKPKKSAPVFLAPFCTSVDIEHDGNPEEVLRSFHNAIVGAFEQRILVNATEINVHDFFDWVFSKEHGEHRFNVPVQLLRQENLPLTTARFCFLSVRSKSMEETANASLSFTNDSVSLCKWPKR